MRHGDRGFDLHSASEGEIQKNEEWVRIINSEIFASFQQSCPRRKLWSSIPVSEILKQTTSCLGIQEPVFIYLAEGLPVNVEISAG